jgi:hypothetical protein
MRLARSMDLGFSGVTFRNVFYRCMFLFAFAASSVSANTEAEKEYALVKAKIEEVISATKRIDLALSQNESPKTISVDIMSVIDLIEVSQNMLERARPENRLEADKILPDLSKVLQKYKVMLRSIEIFDETDNVLRCIMSARENSHKKVTRQEFVKKINLEKLRADTESLFGKKHPLFIKIDSEKSSKADQIDWMLNLIPEIAGGAGIYELDLSAKASAILLIHNASAIEETCVPSQKLLNLMEQISHADQ